MAPQLSVELFIFSQFSCCSSPDGAKAAGELQFTQTRSDPLRLACLVVPPGPDLADLALPVQLLHLLVLAVPVALAADGQHPPVEADPDAEEDEGEEEEDGEDADERDLHVRQERPVRDDLAVLVLLVVL